MSRLSPGSSGSASGSAFLASRAAVSAWVAGDLPRVRAGLLGRPSDIGGSSSSSSRLHLQSADLVHPTRSATSWADDARDAGALAAAAFSDASNAPGCVALLSPGACSSIRSASFAVHLGYPSPRLAEALRLPWVRWCLTAAPFCSSVHCPRLRSASLPPFSCHSLCQLASRARLGHPSPRMVAVALRPYLM